MAEQYAAQGLKSAKVLLGGVDAWRDAGYPLVGPLERKEMTQGEKIEKKW